MIQYIGQLAEKVSMGLNSHFIPAQHDLYFASKRMYYRLRQQMMTPE